LYIASQIQNKIKKMSIANSIREIKDFPKEGINFKDITPLLNNPEARKECLNLLMSGLKELKIDKVVAIESRGFLFGMLLAQELNVGFVPVRKANKLPFKTISASYALEYGTDTLEIHIDAIEKGERVLIHDDVLATGGTAKAVCDLVEQLGGEIVQCNFLIEMTALNGRTKINQYNIFSSLVF
jgi:adenine phosphoribosyltransferase